MTTKQKQDENTLCINRGDHDKSNTAQWNVNKNELQHGHPSVNKATHKELY